MDGYNSSMETLFTLPLTAIRKELTLRQVLNLNLSQQGDTFMKDPERNC